MVVVSAACQSGAIAATLMQIFLGTVVKPIPIFDANNPDLVKKLQDELDQASVWITTGNFDLAQGKKVMVIRIPLIHFDGFQPDMTYVDNLATNLPLKVEFNSRIAVWAYNNSVEIDDAVKLFSGPVYKKLGYCDCWNTSLAMLRNTFLQSDLDASCFNRLMSSVKRRGKFMHTFNHPRVDVLIELAKLIAIKIGASEENIGRSIVVPDGLTDYIWPLYPEIGLELGLEGDYMWRHYNIFMTGIKSYVNDVYAAYTKLGASPGCLRPHARSYVSNFDDILKSELVAR